QNRSDTLVFILWCSYTLVLARALLCRRTLRPGGSSQRQGRRKYHPGRRNQRCWCSGLAGANLLQRGRSEAGSTVRFTSREGSVSTSVARSIASSLLLALALSRAVLAQEPNTSARHLEEIIVTAQKWEQSANTVGMSITAASGDVLQNRGIDSVADLTRLVPRLTIQDSSFNSTSFTLRGVGFFNSDLATP